MRGRAGFLADQLECEAELLADAQRLIRRVKRKAENEEVPSFVSGWRILLLLGADRTMDPLMYFKVAMLRIEHFGHGLDIRRSALCGE